MLFDPSNFLYVVRQIVTGGGRSSGGQPMSDSGFLVDRHVAGATVAAEGATASFSFVIPRDYDEATDELRVAITGKMDGATDTPAVTATVTAQTPGEAAETLANGASVGTFGAALQAFEIDLSGHGLRRGDLVTVALAIGAHTTDALSFVASETHRSTLVSYHDDTADMILR